MLGALPEKVEKRREDAQRIQQAARDKDRRAREKREKRAKKLKEIKAKSKKRQKSAGRSRDDAPRRATS